MLRPSDIYKLPRNEKNFLYACLEITAEDEQKARRQAELRRKMNKAKPTAKKGRRHH